MKTDYILYAIPLFILTILIEAFVAKRKGRHWYRFNDAITNLNIGIGNQAIGIFAMVLILTVYDYFFTHFRLIDWPSTGWAVAGCLLIFDFIFYWAHRWGHTVNFFWGAHVVHHSSEEFNLSVALRQPWFHNLIAFVLFLPLPVLGFHPLIFAGVGAFHTLYQYWIHTKGIGKLGPVGWIFNTPSHHRVHHGVNRHYIDKNYAGFLIIWDRLFDTFEAEKDEVLYGITKPLKSWNPAWANLHYYVELAQQARHLPTWKDRALLLFQKPGWRPRSQGGYQPPQTITKANYAQYDTQATPSMNIYVLIQFAVLLVGLLAYLVHWNGMSDFYRVVFLGIIIITTMICGAIMEGKRWVLVAEYVRLLLVAFSLTTFYYYWYQDWFLIMLVGAIIGFVLFNTWFTLGWLLRPFRLSRQG